MNNYNETVMVYEASTIIDNLDYDGIYTEGFFSNVKASKEKYDNMKKELPDINKGTLRGRRVEKRYNNVEKSGFYSIADGIKSVSKLPKRVVLLMKANKLNNFNIADSKFNIDEAKYDHFDKSVSGKYSIIQLHDIFTDKLNKINIDDKFSILDKKENKQIQILVDKYIISCEKLCNVSKSPDKYVKFLISPSAKKMYSDLCKLEDLADQMKAASKNN